MHLQRYSLHTQGYCIFFIAPKVWWVLTQRPGVISTDAGRSNLTWFVFSLTCWACCKSSIRSCKIWLSNCLLCRRIWRRSLSTASLSSSLCLSVSDSATAWHAGCSCCRALYSVASSSSILCTAIHKHTHTEVTKRQTITHRHADAHAKHTQACTITHKQIHINTHKQTYTNVTMADMSNTVSLHTERQAWSSHGNVIILTQTKILIPQMNFKQCYHENIKHPPAQYKVGPLPQTEIPVK